MPQNDKELLGRLKASGLDFVVIGGVCAIVHGVPVATFDLDICCEINWETMQKIYSAVHDLNPTHRLAANKLPFELNEELASRLKNIYLKTDLGKLDCLGEVAGIGSYQEVFKASKIANLSNGAYRFLTIDALIAAKLAAGRPHDLQTVTHLRAIKEKLQEGELDLWE